MFHRYRLLSCLLLLSAVPLVLARADEQMESDRFEVVAAKAGHLAWHFHGPRHVLVVFAIDNTLLASRQPLGSDQWFTWQAGLLDTAPQSKYLVATSIADLVGKQSALLAINHTRLTQSSVPGTIGRLAERGHPLLILTARGPRSYDLTRQSLESFGILTADSALRIRKPIAEEFKPDALATIAQEFSPDEQVRFRLTKTSPVRYSNGIFLCAGQNKGAMLRLLLRATIADIRAVVFIDDQERNTNAVFDALRDAKPDITTIRFTAEEPAISSFLKGDKQRVHRQWRRFKQLEAELFE